MSNVITRPLEIHFPPINSIERDALPLLSSLVYGERFTSEMINAKDFGTRSVGIHSGFEVKPTSGLGITVVPDVDTGKGIALINIGIQNITVFQQHAINLELVSGSKWNVVLEGFYEVGVLTKQVDASSQVDSATIKVVADVDLLPDHQLLAIVDLTDNATVITDAHIDNSVKTSLSSGSSDLSSPDSSVVTYDGDNVESITEMFGSDAKVTTFNYVAGTLDNMVVVFKGITKTTTYTYDGADTYLGYSVI